MQISNGEVITIVLDKRSTLMLFELMSTSDYIFVKDLMEKLNISRRTVYYDIEKINIWLKDHHLSSVKRSYSKGFYIPEETKKQISLYIKGIEQNQYYYTQEERVSILGIQLMTEKKSLYTKDFMKATDVSRVTVFKDLKSLKTSLNHFDLSVAFDRARGYFIQGDENNKRKALAHYLSQLFVNQGWEKLSQQIQSVLNQEFLNLHESGGTTEESGFPHHGLDDFYSFISEYEQNMKIELADETLHTLALHLLVICKRLQQGLYVQIDKHEKSALRSTPEFVEARKLSDKLEDLHHVHFSEDEICFLTTHLLGAKVHMLNADFHKNKEMVALKKALKAMIVDFQKYACVYFQDQEKLEELMFIHLKPAYYRIKYDVFTENPMTEKIKNQYHEVFQITKKVIFHFENLLGKKLNEEETAYIAMYFGGWMRRQGSRPVTRLRAMIVCENGLGTSNLLRIQLEQLLSTVDIIKTISKREYEQKEYSVDLFFSTVPLQEKGRPVIWVNPILNDADKRNLLFQLNTLNGGVDSNITEPTVNALLDVIQKHANITDQKQLVQDLQSLLQPNRLILKETEKPMLHELLTEEMIQLKPDVPSWEEAIRVAANPLLEKDYIEESYIQAMIENVKELGPYVVIVPNIAIPHARPEHGVKRLGMSLLRLDKPVDFSVEGNHLAQLVIVLAAVDNEAHLKALSQLTTLLSNDNKINQILSASSSEVISQLLIDLPSEENQINKKED